MADVSARTHTIASVPLEVKADGEGGTFEGYGAVFGNIDRDGDVVARGAFAESLKGRLPALLWQHNAKEPIGRFDVVREDAKGLYVKGRLSMEGRGREAYELLKMGALDGLSIGFVTREATRDAATGTRTITRAELMEISLVTFPANELARVSAVKSVGQGLPDSPRDFERMLRENGFSRARAKAITAKGFGGFGVAAGGEDIAAMVDDLRVRQRMLEQKAAPSTILRVSGSWSPWQRFPAITLSRPTKFKLFVSRRNDTLASNPFKGPLFLEVDYVSPNGRTTGQWQSHANGLPTTFEAAAGVQEIGIRGHTVGFDEVKVTLLFR